MSVSADRLRLLRRQAGQADVRAPVVADDGDALHDAAAVDAKAVDAAPVGEVAPPAAGTDTQGTMPAPGHAPGVSAERLRLLRRQVGGLTPAARKADAVMPTRAQRAAAPSAALPTARPPLRGNAAARHGAVAGRPNEACAASTRTPRALQSPIPAPPARDASVFAWVEHDVRHKPALPSTVDVDVDVDVDAIIAVDADSASHWPTARGPTTASPASMSPVHPVQRRTDIAGLRKMIGLRERAVSAHAPVRAPSTDRSLPGNEIAPGLHLIQAFLPQAIPTEALSLAFAKRDDAVDPMDLLFFDTETTGLAGGTGTRAFMIGVADWVVDAVQGSGLRVRQLMMSTMAAESAMLDLFRTWLTPRTVLSSYNGRCYDAPLLKTRYRLARRGDPLSALDHVDLLFPTRRRYRGTWENCKLATIERQLLRVVREDDLPGSEAPAAWLSYLRGGSARNLRRVAEHNHQDVVTLSLLMQRLVAVDAQERNALTLACTP
ncbi:MULTISPECIES: ribonuclease H-like domain-containing protein [Xanthomonas]|uniref:YprB ribonuclease H-like domain-containing protein n=2 Tax=Xanthomonas TaxID=338 RepID=A0A7Z7NFY7_XANCH|nr:MULTISPECIES: ribonuclease H-like domain-containing protein [Xanthomonas]ATS37122.1 ribonuclease H-like domain-containing protein [Xanthomonas citri pv. phaseoli var. fuscans]ATS44069.1 ribonuclease H-like domain-containing protein [Xanthomonas citri pv. phaseoli var. fuscans]ATS49019.1 ribonuclease H-like domain-containing protein [Xanthomonas citri pv. phaseoli var. fuscans]ATS84609.1 ribonuclease H-like domain-containing protein [Xanthomonas citri pv. phaseoli var. fuscans]QWN18799.1 exo